MHVVNQFVWSRIYIYIYPRWEFPVRSQRITQEENVVRSACTYKPCVNESCVLVFVCMRLTPWMSHTRVVNRKTKPCARSLLYNGITIYDNARHARDYRNFNSSPICHIETRLRRLEFYSWYHGFYCKKTNRSDFSCNRCTCNRCV